MDILRVKVNNEWVDIPALVGPQGESGNDQNAVHFNETQNLTNAQKSTARNNIGAASTGDITTTLANFAGAFVQATAYPAGTYVTYTDGFMYVLSDGHEADVTWANTTKTKVTTGGELSDLKSAIDYISGGLDFTKDTLDVSVSGEYIEYNGAIESASSWSRSNPIEIGKTLKEITVTKGSAYCNIAFFYSSTIGTSTFISWVRLNTAVTPSAPVSVDIPNGATYFVISNNNNNSDFACTLTYDSMLDLFDKIESVESDIYGNDAILSLSDSALTDAGKYIASNGTLDSAGSFSASGMYEFNPMIKNIVVNSCGKNSGIVVGFYKTDEFTATSFLGGFTSPNSAITSDNPQTIIPPKGTKYVAVCNSRSGETQPLDVAFKYSSVVEKIDAVGSSFETVFSKTSNVIYDSTKKVKFIGDSITAGVGGTGYATTGEIIYGDKRVNGNGHCWANSLKAYLEDKFGLTAYNYGVSGINSRQLYDNITSIIHGDENLIICMIGTNDRQDTQDGVPQTIYDYMGNLAKIKAYCDSLGIPIVFMASIPASVTNETDASRHYHMEDVDMACCRFAGENNMEYISVYKLFIEYCKYTNTTIDSYLSDGLHPNDSGYDVMFYLIANALGFSTKRPDATW